MDTQLRSITADVKKIPMTEKVCQLYSRKNKLENLEKGEKQYEAVKCQYLRMGHQLKTQLRINQCRTSQKSRKVSEINNSCICTPSPSNDCNSSCNNNNNIRTLSIPHTFTEIPETARKVLHKLVNPFTTTKISRN